MSNQTTEIDSLEKLQATFESYSHLPREAIIKQDILRLGLDFVTSSVDDNGYKHKDYFIFTFDHVPIESQDSNLRYRIPEEIRLSGGIFDFRSTVISVRYDPTSPYQVKLHENKRKLFFREELLGEVDFPAIPAYYRYELKNKKKPGEIAPLIEWGYLIYLTIFRNCQYFGREEECAFCDINHNYRQQKNQGRPYTGVKSIAEILEVLEWIAASTPEAKAYTITGGSVIKTLRGKNEQDFYFDYVSAIEKKFPNKWIGKIVTQAWEKKELTRFKDAGIEIYHPNYEVWDKDLFAKICPGKNRYIGRDLWMKRIIDAAKIFTPAGVIPNFVAGVELSKPYGFASIAEAIRSTHEGLDFFMSQGIVPRFTTWCKEPYTTLSEIAEQPLIPLEYFLELLTVWRETFYRYQLPIPRGYGEAGAGKAVFAVSAFMDVLEEK